MLIPFDDYPVHQTAEPLSYMASSERNMYARYWYNGYDFDGEFYIGIAFAAYPNREVMDGAVSVVRKDGTQHSFRASRRLRGDRTDLYAGPMRHEIVEPMRIVRVTVEKNNTGFACDLTFHANTVAHEEPADYMKQGVRTVAQMKRFSQFGRWEGWIEVDGKRQEINPATTFGTKDRSWGWRWTGETEKGISRDIPEQFFWLWAPIHWQDRCTHWGQHEYVDSKRCKEFAQVFRTWPIKSDFDVLDEGDVEAALCADHRLEFARGSRLISRAEIDTVYRDGRKETFVLEPLLRYHMYGTGYNHPEWGHGFYKCEEAHTLESWDINKIDVNAPQYMHVQQVVRATCGDQVGSACSNNISSARTSVTGSTAFSIRPEPRQRAAKRARPAQPMSAAAMGANRSAGAVGDRQKCRRKSRRGIACICGKEWLPG
ncbi:MULTISPECIES: hypothetical protein [unclassified Sphingopyxis]|uniref:hypothetical protein n=1 Tax=unclassified Sphingopyxis TaxID=2614943 RepID=UPI00286C19C2|nr:MULTISPECIES: hypothetical protein [unclassified Sphingopyxis]